jgi:hypothetical protein
VEVIEHPSFDPPYNPHLDENGVPRQNSFIARCHDEISNEMDITFQPWNHLSGWLGIEDTTTGEWAVEQQEWTYGETHTLPMREGFVLHYWSGSSDDLDHPEANIGHYEYRIIPGQCTTSPSTTTTQPESNSSTTTTVVLPESTSSSIPIITTITEVTVQGTSTSLVALSSPGTQTQRDSLPVTGSDFSPVDASGLAAVLIVIGWLTTLGFKRRNHTQTT